MQTFCCDCENLDRKNEYKDWFSGEIKYKCIACGDYKKLTDTACYSNFKELRKDTGSYTPAGCFITTIVCNILGYDDNCELLVLFRNFRDTVLKTNPMYLPILVEYDIIGPLISMKIEKEKNHYGLALGLMNHFLLPCANAIKNENIDEAVEIYSNMVNYLRDEYELPLCNVNMLMNKNLDIETLGKGRIRETKPSGC